MTEASSPPRLAPAVRAFQALKALLAELEELKKHTHGFAYPECPKCKREDEIQCLLKLK